MFILSLVFGYLLGSIPFGLVLCKLAGYGDIRKIGSGNIGATNVLRTGNKPLALATLLLDSGKGAIAVGLAYLLTRSFFPECTTIFVVDDPSPLCYPEGTKAFLYLAGLGAVLGHLFPIWLKFRGGKGVATTLGTLLAISPLLGAITCLTWFTSALIFRISSLSALIAIGFTPLVAHYLYNDTNLSILCAVITALVYFKHRENIKRIFAGTEPKIGKGKDKAKSQQKDGQK